MVKICLDNQAFPYVSLTTTLSVSPALALVSVIPALIRPRGWSESLAVGWQWRVL